MRSKKPAEFLEAETQSLLGGDEQALVGVDVRRVDAIARLVGQVGLEAIGERLVDEGVAVGKEKDVAGLVGALKTSMRASWCASCPCR